MTCIEVDPSWFKGYVRVLQVLRLLNNPEEILVFLRKAVDQVENGDYKKEFEKELKIAEDQYKQQTPYDQWTKSHFEEELSKQMQKYCQKLGVNIGEIFSGLEQIFNIEDIYIPGDIEEKRRLKTRDRMLREIKRKEDKEQKREVPEWMRTMKIKVDKEFIRNHWLSYIVRFGVEKPIEVLKMVDKGIFPSRHMKALKLHFPHISEMTDIAQERLGEMFDVVYSEQEKLLGKRDMYYTCEESFADGISLLLKTIHLSQLSDQFMHVLLHTFDTRVIGELMVEMINNYAHSQLNRIFHTRIATDAIVIDFAGMVYKEYQKIKPHDRNRIDWDSFVLNMSQLIVPAMLQTISKETPEYWVDMTSDFEGVAHLLSSLEDYYVGCGSFHLGVIALWKGEEESAKKHFALAIRENTWPQADWIRDSPWPYGPSRIQRRANFIHNKDISLLKNYWDREWLHELLKVDFNKLPLKCNYCLQHKDNYLPTRHQSALQHLLVTGHFDVLDIPSLTWIKATCVVCKEEWFADGNAAIEHCGTGLMSFDIHFFSNLFAF